jgi:hypothetical protein
MASSDPFCGAGQVEIEDFRVITESFGMQLDDDSLLALFSRVRPSHAVFIGIRTSRAVADI